MWDRSVSRTLNHLSDSIGLLVSTVWTIELGRNSLRMMQPSFVKTGFIWTLKLMLTWCYLWISSDIRICCTFYLWMCSPVVEVYLPVPCCANRASRAAPCVCTALPTSWLRSRTSRLSCPSAVGSPQRSPTSSSWPTACRMTSAICWLSAPTIGVNCWTPASSTSTFPTGSLMGLP